MEYTGERFIPGKIEGDITAEHIHRYRYITSFTEGKIVVDAACGDGYGTDIIAENAAMAYGIDISKEAIDNANRKYKRKNLMFQIASIDKMPFEDSSIDVIVSFETIEHVDEEMQKMFLAEVKRVLKSDGLLIVSTPNKRLYSDLPGYKNDYHKKEFSIDELKGFLEDYFLYVDIYNQSFERFNVICNMDGDKKNNQEAAILNFNNNLLNMYVIAICSNTKTKTEKNIHSLFYCKKAFLSSLYLDFGNGFSEENKVTGELSYNGIEFTVSFNLPDISDVRAIRWDPIEGRFCKIMIEKIDVDCGNVYISSSSAAYKKDSLDVFFTIDPVYFLDGEFHKARQIKVKGIMSFDISLEVERELKKLEDSRKKLLYDLNRIVTINTKISEIESVVKELLDLNKRKNKELQEKYRALQQEYEKRSIEIEKLQLEYETVVGEINILEKDKNELLNGNKNLLKNIDHLTEKLNETEKNFESQKLEKDELQKYIELLKLEKDELKNNLDAVLGSFSWKVTKPYRNIMDFFRSL